MWGRERVEGTCPLVNLTADPLSLTEPHPLTPSPQTWRGGTRGRGPDRENPVSLVPRQPVTSSREDPSGPDRSPPRQAGARASPSICGCRTNRLAPATKSQHPRPQVPPSTFDQRICRRLLLRRIASGARDRRCSTRGDCQGFLRQGSHVLAKGAGIASCAGAPQGCVGPSTEEPVAGLPERSFPLSASRRGGQGVRPRGGEGVRK